MVEAASFSLKQNSMPLPPWRSLAYLEAKWHSPYQRQFYPDEKISNLPSAHKQCSGHLKRLQSLLQSEIEVERVLKPINRENNRRLKLERRRYSSNRALWDVQVLSKNKWFLFSFSDFLQYVQTKKRGSHSGRKRILTVETFFFFHLVGSLYGFFSSFLPLCRWISFFCFMFYLFSSFILSSWETIAWTITLFSHFINKAVEVEYLCCAMCLIPFNFTIALRLFILLFLTFCLFDQSLDCCC